MTYRERMEARIAKRQEWAEKRTAKAEALRKATPDSLRHDWAFITQPGHIPERAKTIARDDRAHEHDKMAAHHETRAAALGDHLSRSIFSDDHDAPEALRERIAKLEEERAAMKRANVAFRKGGAAGLVKECGEGVALEFAKLLHICPWEKQPYPGYALSNLGANIARLRKRLVEVTERADTTAKAQDASGGVLVEHVGEFARVTFAEKPERGTVDALKAAGFRWGAGSWVGLMARLPDGIR